MVEGVSNSGVAGSQRIYFKLFKVIRPSNYTVERRRGGMTQLLYGISDDRDYGVLTPGLWSNRHH